MKIKNIALVFLGFVLSQCHTGPVDTHNLEDLFAKGDSIAAKSTRSSSALDSVTDRTIDIATQNIRLLTKTIEIYKTKNTKLMIVESNTKTINKVDTVFIKVDHGALGSETKTVSVKSDTFTTTKKTRDSSMVVFWGRERRKITVSEMNQAKDMIRSLSDDIRAYNSEIAKLVRQNSALTSENLTIKGQLAELTLKLDEATLALAKNQEIIDIASTLDASDFSVVAVHEKDNGKIIKSNAASRINKLKIEFSLNRNRIAQSSADLYIRILTPDSTLVQDEDSATFLTREGTQIGFTCKLSEYRESQRVQFDWKVPANFKRGVYLIEVYQNGFKIKDGTLTLKK